jgi:hypothetical protein
MTFASFDAFIFGYVSKSKMNDFITLKEYKNNLKYYKSYKNPKNDKEIENFIQNNIIKWQKAIQHLQKLIYGRLKINNLSEFKKLPQLKIKNEEYTMLVTKIGKCGTHYSSFNS